jgi:hypothetical protein
MNNHEITTNKLADKLLELSQNVNQRFQEVGLKFSSLESQLHDLLDFLQEHATTKEDLKAFATKEDLFATKSELRREIATLKLDIIDRMDAKLLELENRLIRRFSPLLA